DAVVGASNYDIGHVFSTGGGGIARLGGVWLDGFKGQGGAGSAHPTGGGFGVGFVGDEIGPPFNASPTFNRVTNNGGSGNREPPDAYEPGSGSTIMAYAGICGAQDLQPHSDDYFHAQSLAEIIAFLSHAGCAVQTATNNTAPTVNAGANFTVP